MITPIYRKGGNECKAMQFVRCRGIRLLKISKRNEYLPMGSPPGTPTAGGTHRAARELFLAPTLRAGCCATPTLRAGPVGKQFETIHFSPDGG